MGYDYIRKKPEDKRPILDKFKYRKFSIDLTSGRMFSSCQINNIENKPCKNLTEVMQTYIHKDSFYLKGVFNNGKEFVLLKKYVMVIEDESTKDVPKEEEKE